MSVSYSVNGRPRSMDDDHNDSHADESNTMLVVLCLIASIGGLLFGYDTGIISGALVVIDQDFYLNDVDEELIVSLTVAGALISSIFAGKLGDTIGRKPVILMSSVAFIVGSVIMAVALDFVSLIIGRFIVGLGVGSASMIVPIYLAECAPTKYRGSIVAVMNVAVTFGELLACIIASIFSTTPGGWRYMLGIAAIPALIQLVGFSVMPESPRYYMQMNDIDNGKMALAILRGHLDVCTIFCSGGQKSDSRSQETFKRIAYEAVTEEANGILSAIKAEHDAIQREALFELDSTRESLTLLKDSFHNPLISHSSSQHQDEDNVADNYHGDNNDQNDNANNHSSGENGSIQQSNESSSSSSPRSLHTVPLVGGGRSSRISTSSDDGGGSNGLSYQKSTMNHSKIEVNTGKLLMKTSTFRALILGCLLQAGNQFGGINLVMYYGASIFTLGGASRVLAIWLSIGLAFCNFVGSLTSFYLTDRVGRRPLTLLSMFGVSLSLFAIGMAFYGTRDARKKAANSQDGDDFDGNLTDIDPSLWIIFATICIYLLCFAPGMGSTPWTICSEIYPMSVRGVATSITTACNWSAGLIMSMTFLTITSSLGKTGAFSLYSVISLTFFIFFYFYLPETKGVWLEDTGLLFTDGLWGKMKGWKGWEDARFGRVESVASSVSTRG